MIKFPAWLPRIAGRKRSATLIVAAAFMRARVVTPDGPRTYLVVSNEPQAIFEDDLAVIIETGS
jgi:hypothetical protein